MRDVPIGVAKRKNRGFHRGFFVPPDVETPCGDGKAEWESAAVCEHLQSGASREWLPVSAQGSLIALIGHLATNHGQQDLRIQDICLGDGNQVLAEYG